MAHGRYGSWSIRRLASADSRTTTPSCRECSSKSYAARHVPIPPPSCSSPFSNNREFDWLVLPFEVVLELAASQRQARCMFSRIASFPLQQSLVHSFIRSFAHSFVRSFTGNWMYCTAWIHYECGPLFIARLRKCVIVVQSRVHCARPDHRGSAGS